MYGFVTHYVAFLLHNMCCSRILCCTAQVAYAWAVELGGSEGAVLLQRLGLADGAVEYAMEVGAFAHAFQLAEGAAKEKLADVHLKYAMFLEDAGRFAEAEQEFLNAGGLC
jgi:intraflagellar transport protein 172